MVASGRIAALQSVEPEQAKGWDTGLDVVREHVTFESRRRERAPELEKAPTAKGVDCDPGL